MKKQKKSQITYEVIMHIVFIGMFTLIIIGSVYYFSSLTKKNDFDTEANEAFSKLKCILNEENVLFKNKAINNYGSNDLYTIDYDTYKSISSGIGNEYNDFESACNFDDQRESTFAFSIHLEAEKEHSEELKDIIDKEIYINKDAYDYYEKILSNKRNTLKAVYDSRGKGTSIMITQDYSVLIIKGENRIPAVLKVNLIMPSS